MHLRNDRDVRTFPIRYKSLGGFHSRAHTGEAAADDDDVVLDQACATPCRKKLSFTIRGGASVLHDVGSRLIIVFADQQASVSKIAGRMVGRFGRRAEV